MSNDPRAVFPAWGEGAGDTVLCLNDHIQDFDAADIARITLTLPQWRQEAANRFRHLQGRRECVLSYIELCRALQTHYGITEMPAFAQQQHGKPYLPEYPTLHFSLSHCREAVGCLLSTRPCGLDIERIREAKVALVRYTMNENEQQNILSAPCPDLAFTRLWTQKEAVFKLRGTGIHGDIRQILAPQHIQDIVLMTTENPARGYVFSIALLREGKAATGTVPIMAPVHYG